MIRAVLIAATFAYVLAPIRVSAQEAPTFRPRQVVVSGGALLAGGYPVGDLTATMRRNAQGTPAPFTLLRAESKITGGSGVEARVALALTRAFAIEVGGAYAKPNLDVTVSQDPELPESVTASERIDQYAVEISALYQLPWSLGRRMRPYAVGGGGYLRQLHEGRLLVETGATLHAGAGLQFWLTRTNVRRAFGLRGEARYAHRRGAIDFEDRSRGFASARALAFFAF